MVAKKITASALRKACGESKLMRAVASWAISKGRDYEDGAAGAFSDLFNGGCESGMVSHLVYYCDTIAFAKKHLAEILELAIEDGENQAENAFTMLGQCRGASSCGDAGQCLNFLAWYGFETAARKLADAVGYGE